MLPLMERTPDIGDHAEDCRESISLLPSATHERPVISDRLICKAVSISPASGLGAETYGCYNIGTHLQAHLGPTAGSRTDHQPNKCPYEDCKSRQAYKHKTGLGRLLKLQLTSNDLQFICPHEDCKSSIKTFPRKFELDRHCAQKHSSIRAYTCPVVGCLRGPHPANFARLDKLTDHIRSCHSDQPRLACPH